MRSIYVVVALLLLGGFSDDQQPFDLVIQGGRVMDPETGLDGTRDVGINGN
jgi:hypothetical protein